MYPVALETILRAEVVLFSELLAVRTLQRTRIVLAVFACALARGVCGHRVRWCRACRGCGRGGGGLIFTCTRLYSAQGTYMWRGNGLRTEEVVDCDFRLSHGIIKSEFVQGSKAAGRRSPITK